MFKRINKHSLKLLVLPLAIVMVAMPMVASSTVSADSPSCYTMLVNTNYKKIDEGGYFINHGKDVNFNLQVYASGEQLNKNMPAKLKTVYYLAPKLSVLNKSNIKSPNDRAIVKTVFSEAKYVGVSNGIFTLTANVPVEKNLVAETSVDQVRLTGTWSTCYVTSYSGDYDYMPKTTINFWRTIGSIAK